MKVIKYEQAKEHLGKEIKGTQNCNEAIDKFVSFYKNFKFQESNTSEDDDMLLFQYGVYDWDGSGKKFELNLTRQFVDPSGDEFTQLSFTLYYDYNEIGDIEDFNSWSIDYDNILQWKSNMEATIGFINCSKLTPIRVELEINNT